MHMLLPNYLRKTRLAITFKRYNINKVCNKLNAPIKYFLILQNFFYNLAMRCILGSIWHYGQLRVKRNQFKLFTFKIRGHERAHTSPKNFTNQLIWVDIKIFILRILIKNKIHLDNYLYPTLLFYSGFATG